MKKIHIFIYLCLSVMLMTVCGCKNDKVNTIESDSSNAEKAADVEDKRLTAESAVISVGDEKVRYDEFLVYMYILNNRYESSMGEDIWSYRLPAGRSLESLAKEQTVSLITELKIISRKAKEYGIEPGEDEKESIRQYAEELYADIQKEDRSAYMLTVDNIASVYMENDIADKVYTSCIGGVDTNISDEEVKQITVQYIYTTDARKAQKIRQRAGKRKDFAALARETTEADGIDMTLGRGDAGTEFENAAFALKSGEMSQVVQAPEGYYIIYCVSDYEQELTAIKKEEIIAARQQEIFEEQYSQWRKECDIQISNLIL